MPEPQEHVDGLQSVPGPQSPPQLGLHKQAHAFGSAAYVGPQFNPTVSHTHPHTPPVLLNLNPTGHDALCLHSHVHEAVLHC